MGQNSPFFSLVIPLLARNSSLLFFTLQSLASQKYTSFEVLLIDGREEKDCPKPWEGMELPNWEIVSLPGASLPALQNEGLSLAQGAYIHFLLPGEFYLSNNSLVFAHQFLLKSQKPDLMYAGCMIRHSFAAPEVLLKEIDREALQKGDLCPTMQPYFFLKDSLLALGGLSEQYEIQAGLEKIYQYFSLPEMKKVYMPRILTDYEYRLPTPAHLLLQMKETCSILFSYFGLRFPLFLWVRKVFFRFVLWEGKKIQRAVYKQRKPFS